MTRKRLITSAWLLGAEALTLPLTVQPFRYGDEWWHIALGREILAHGIPVQEPFSFVAAGNHWVEVQWLYEVFLAKLVDLGGAGLASLAMGLLGSLALFLAALAIPRAEPVGGGWRAAALLIGGLVAGPALGVRGEVITVLGVAVTLLIVQRWRDGDQRAVWLLPPMFLLWVNCHAGFVAGLALLMFTLGIHRNAAHPGRVTGLALAGLAAGLSAVVGGLVTGAVVLAVLWGLIRPVPLAAAVSRRRLAAATAASLAITLVNPAGPAIYGYIADTVANPLLSQFVSEWLSPNFHDPFTRLIVAAAALLVLAWAVSGRARAEDVLLAVAAFVATLQAIRNVLLFAVIAIPQLAEYGAAAWAARAPRWLRRPPARLSPAMALIAAAAVATASVISVVGRLPTSAAADFERSRDPAGAAGYVAAHLSGQRLLSTDQDGGYLAYRFPQGRVVFVYDEIGLFGEQILNEYLDVAQLRDDWRSVLDRYQIHHAVLPAAAADTSALLELGWRVDCFDSPSGRVVMSDHPGAIASAPPPDPASALPCS